MQYIGVQGTAMFLSIRNYIVFFFILMGTATAFAQASNNPPAVVPTPDPWGGAVPQTPPGVAPAPAVPGAVPPSGVPAPGSDSFFVPTDPGMGGFDYFEDEEDPWGGGGSTGGSGGSQREGKSSFKLLSPTKERACTKWGNNLLGPATFSDKSICEAELDRKVDQGRASIEEMNDGIERFKLKKVIRGDLGSRNEARKYDITFESLRKALENASASGCTCQK
jgi:hypothetical protein